MAGCQTAFTWVSTTSPTTTTATATATATNYLNIYCIDACRNSPRRACCKPDEDNGSACRCPYRIGSRTLGLKEKVARARR